MENDGKQAPEGAEHWKANPNQESQGLAQPKGLKHPNIHEFTGNTIDIGGIGHTISPNDTIVYGTHDIWIRRKKPKT